MQRQQHTHNGLSYPAMLILASLEQGPRHALALCEAIEQTEGLFIEPGTLYRALARLERQGQVEVLDEDSQEGPLRLYRITASGMLTIERASARQPNKKPRAGERPLLLRGKEIIMRLVILMLRLYPSAWRERYETEMVALLQQHEITHWTVLDLLMGALDARLDPHYRGSRALRDVCAANLPPRYTAPSKSKGWSALLIVPFVTITLMVIISRLTHMSFVHGPIFMLILSGIICGTMGAMITYATLKKQRGKSRSPTPGAATTDAGLKPGRFQDPTQDRRSPRFV